MMGTDKADEGPCAGQADQEQEMQERQAEDVANHNDPESCGVCAVRCALKR